MEIKIKLTLLALVIFTGCTSNPFWSDSPSKKINIQGYVFKQDSVSNVPAFVFVDGLGVSTNTDENGFYSIDLPNLEMENGNFSGSVKIYYYIHNYKVFYSTLYITNGRLTSLQTDFDENGVLLEPVRLEKIMSLDISIDRNFCCAENGVIIATEGGFSSSNNLSNSSIIFSVSCSLAFLVVSSLSKSSTSKNSMTCSIGLPLIFKT